MHVHYWQSPEGKEGNFGDDLNAWLWRALLPGDWDDNTDVMLAGAGTVLTHQLPAANRLVVLGSGAGYGSLPDFIHQPHCRCYGFRGPLTARLLGYGEDYVLADPAILIPDVLEVPPLPPNDRQVVFVPHLDSMRRSDWGKVCRMAGIALVDPRDESKQVIRQLARARLVLAESMHAAILADAYRVPWIPVWSSREISRFKWNDWALAVGARVRPVFVHPPSRIGWLDDKMAAVALNDNANLASLSTEQPDLSAAVRELAAQQARRRDRSIMARRRRYLKIRRKLLLPLLNAIGNHPTGRISRTATQLQGLASQQGYLSDEQQFQAARQRLYQALQRLAADRQDGFNDLPKRAA
ncbi:polysaccharide pyruvyl transferase family protein [Bowmanella dokdonensis]|uniref:Polysaccharide pyruvyl transferase family protein n=1 Tax=Bowmanella dokdonensis TaxID=751969 RepID=A0A939DL85_9ALTE|nr:polysaccharide pyruvyl transferase family protein [Bowmanella dokdonensis]MBN7824692.1 polysaccharide pyruvyl transferase family protein [Bowmanella dokdonensis]